MSNTLKSWEDLQQVPEHIFWSLDFTNYEKMVWIQLRNLYYSYLYQHIFLKTYFDDTDTKVFLEQIENEVLLHLNPSEDIASEEEKKLWFQDKIERIVQVMTAHGMADLQFTDSFLDKGDFIFRDGRFCYYHTVISISDIYYHQGDFKRSSDIDFDRDPNKFSEFEAILFFNDLLYILYDSDNEKYKKLKDAIDWNAPHFIGMDWYSFTSHYSVDDKGMTGFLSGYCYAHAVNLYINLSEGGKAFLSDFYYLRDSSGRRIDDEGMYEQQEEDINENEYLEDTEITFDEEHDLVFMDYGQMELIRESARKDFNRIKALLPGLGLNNQLGDL